MHVDEDDDDHYDDDNQKSKKPQTRAKGCAPNKKRWIDRG